MAARTLSRTKDSGGILKLNDIIAALDREPTWRSFNDVFEAFKQRLGHTQWKNAPLVKLAWETASRVLKLPQEVGHDLALSMCAEIISHNPAYATPEVLNQALSVALANPTDFMSSLPSKGAAARQVILSAVGHADADVMEPILRRITIAAMTEKESSEQPSSFKYWLNSILTKKPELARRVAMDEVERGLKQGRRDYKHLKNACDLFLIVATHCVDVLTPDHARLFVLTIRKFSYPNINSPVSEIITLMAQRPDLCLPIVKALSEKLRMTKGTSYGYLLGNLVSARKPLAQQDDVRQLLQSALTRKRRREEYHGGLVALRCFTVAADYEGYIKDAWKATVSALRSKDASTRGVALHNLSIFATACAEKHAQEPQDRQPSRTFSYDPRKLWRLAIKALNDSESRNRPYGFKILQTLATHHTDEYGDRVLNELTKRYNEDPEETYDFIGPLAQTLLHKRPNLVNHVLQNLIFKQMKQYSYNDRARDGANHALEHMIPDMQEELLSAHITEFARAAMGCGGSFLSTRNIKLIAKKSPGLARRLLERIDNIYDRESRTEHQATNTDYLYSIMAIFGEQPSLLDKRHAQSLGRLAVSQYKELRGYVIEALPEALSTVPEDNLSEVIKGLCSGAGIKKKQAGDTNSQEQARKDTLEGMLDTNVPAWRRMAGIPPTIKTVVQTLSQYTPNQ